MFHLYNKEGERIKRLDILLLPHVMCSKLLMRWTVLTSDAIIFFPAALYFIAVYYNGRKDEDLVWAHAMILLQPCAILIDHGQFQVRWCETIFTPCFHFSLVIWYVLLTSSCMDSLDKPTEKNGKKFSSLYKNNPHEEQKGGVGREGR